MLLKDKVAVIYGAAGAVGTAVASVFARQGARLFLSGRTLEPVDRLAAEIVAAGGSAEAARVDALEAEAVESHLAKVVKASGRVDISFNLISLGDSQGQMLTGVSPAAFVRPVETAMRSQIITAGAAARRMVAQRSGVMISRSPAPRSKAYPASSQPSSALTCGAIAD